MIALPSCEDAFEPPGEWEERVDGDLSDGMELPAVGTDWRKLPPWEFVAVMADACHGEQELMELSVFGKLYSYEIIRFWCNDWSEMLDSFGGDPKRALFNAVICTDVVLARDEDGGWYAIDHRGRLPKYGRCEHVSTTILYDCAGVYPSYRTPLGRCEVANG